MKTPTPSQRKHGPNELEEALTLFIKSGSANGREEMRRKCLKLVPAFASAPDLLTALQRMVETFDESNTSTKTQRREAIMEAVSALRKAKGGGDEK